MMRSTLIVLALTAAACHGILPEIVDWGINHIVEGPSELDRLSVEQRPEDMQLKPEDAFPQVNKSSHHNDLHLSHQNETVSDKKSDITSAVPDSDLENDIDHIFQLLSLSFLSPGEGCITDDDCDEGKYCFSDTQNSNSKCRPCKETDVSCTKDAECCSEQLCVWGQCSQNATKGEAGSTCQQQTDCSPDLCCAFHNALSIPVCLAKPMERERCYGDSNHLMELLSWDIQDRRPRKHCPCAGDLQCQHLGRGSMCLKGEDSGEEDLTDSLYSEIDYIL